MSEAIDMEDLRTGIRDVLDAEASSERILRHYDGDASIAADLRRIAADLGWAALGVPESHGGLGLGLCGLAVLYEELGRGPAPLPLLPTMVVADVLARSGSADLQARWLPVLAGGATFAALAFDGRATFAAGQVSGRFEHVVDAVGAALLLIPAGDGYVLVEADQPGVAITPLPAVDRTRTLATITLTDATGATVAVDAEALATHAALGVAADCVGGAAAILAKTIAYLKVREQFGKPIGSFQALKHRIADHHLALELAQSLMATAIAAADGGTDGHALAALARVTAAETYAAIADDAVQLHGGIGFTWEHDCHLYLKRARMNEMLYGNAERHLDSAAAHLMGQAA